MKTLTLLLSFLIILSCGYGKTNNKTTSKIIQNKIKVIINAKVLENDVFEVYYYESGQETFHPLDFVSSIVNGDSSSQEIVFELPELIYPERLRLDFGKNKTQNSIQLYGIKLALNSKEYVFDSDEIVNEFKPSKFIDFDKNKLVIKTKIIHGRYDPYFYSKNISNIVNYLLED